MVLLQIAGKSITEGENLLKRLINEMTPQQIDTFRITSATHNCRKRKRRDCNEALTHGAARCTHAGMNWSTSAA